MANERRTSRRSRRFVRAITDVANTVAYVQNRGGGNDAFRGLVGMMAVARSVRFRMPRMGYAQDALAARLGVDLGGDSASDERTVPGER